MNRSELRSLARLAADKAYIETLSRRDRIITANPAMTATMGERDPKTGKYFINTADGGSTLANSITSGGLRQGAVIPSAVANGGANFIDSKPVN